MKEEDNIATFFLQVDEVVIPIRGLGEEPKDTMTIKKILTYIPQGFNAKIFVIKENRYLITKNG